MFRHQPIAIGVMLAALAATAPASAQTQTQTVEQKAQLCATCHGEKGIPVDPSFPIIWGQHQGYLFLQLRDFKAGTRKNEFMAPVVADLSRDEMMALAEYFSKKSWPDLRQKPASDAESAIAYRANASVGCTGCHLGQYQGDATVPRLAGQNRDYLLKQMKSFFSGARGNNPGMTDLMKITPAADLMPMADDLAGR